MFLQFPEFKTCAHDCAVLKPPWCFACIMTPGEFISSVHIHSPGLLHWNRGNRIDGLMQKRRNTSASALGLRLFCIKPSTWCTVCHQWSLNVYSWVRIHIGTHRTHSWSWNVYSWVRVHWGTHRTHSCDVWTFIAGLEFIEGPKEDTHVKFERL